MAPFSKMQPKKDPVLLNARAMELCNDEVGCKTTQRDKKYFLDVVELNSEAMRLADPSMWKDRDFVLAAMRLNGMALHWAPHNLKADREVVLAAIESNGMAMYFADPRLQEDFEFLMECIEANQEALGSVAAVWRGDPELLALAAPKLFEDISFVLHMVRKRGIALRSAGDFRGDHEVVLQAVMSDGLGLEFADPMLRSRDHDIVLAAVSQNGMALKFAGADFQGDHAIVKAAMTDNPLAFQFADSHVRRDPLMVMCAAGLDIVALKYAAKGVMSKYNIGYFLVRKDGLALQYLGEALQKDLHIAMSAIRQNPEAKQFVLNPLASSKRFKAELAELKKEQGGDADASPSSAMFGGLFGGGQAAPVPKIRPGMENSEAARRRMSAAVRREPEVNKKPGKVAKLPNPGAKESSYRDKKPSVVERAERLWDARSEEIAAMEKRAEGNRLHPGNKGTERGSPRDSESEACSDDDFTHQPSGPSQPVDLDEEMTKACNMFDVARQSSMIAEKRRPSKKGCPVEATTNHAHFQRRVSMIQGALPKASSHQHAQDTDRASGPGHADEMTRDHAKQLPFSEQARMTAALALASSPPGSPAGGKRPLGTQLEQWQIMQAMRQPANEYYVKHVIQNRPQSGTVIEKAMRRRDAGPRSASAGGPKRDPKQPLAPGRQQTVPLGRTSIALAPVNILNGLDNRPTIVRRPTNKGKNGWGGGGQVQQKSLQVQVLDSKLDKMLRANNDALLQNQQDHFMELEDQHKRNSIGSIRKSRSEPTIDRNPLKRCMSLKAGLSRPSMCELREHPELESPVSEYAELAEEAPASVESSVSLPGSAAKAKARPSLPGDLTAPTANADAAERNSVMIDKMSNATFNIFVGAAIAEDSKLMRRGSASKSSLDLGAGAALTRSGQKSSLDLGDGTTERPISRQSTFERPSSRQSISKKRPEHEEQTVAPASTKSVQSSKSRLSVQSTTAPISSKSAQSSKSRMSVESTMAPMCSMASRMSVDSTMEPMKSAQTSTSRDRLCCTQGHQLVLCLMNHCQAADSTSDMQSWQCASCETDYWQAPGAEYEAYRCSKCNYNVCRECVDGVQVAASPEAVSTAPQASSSSSMPAAAPPSVEHAASEPRQTVSVAPRAQEVSDYSTANSMIHSGFTDNVAAWNAAESGVTPMPAGLPLESSQHLGPQIPLFPEAWAAQQSRPMSPGPPLQGFTYPGPSLPPFPITMVNVELNLVAEEQQAIKDMSRPSSPAVDPSCQRHNAQVQYTSYASSPKAESRPAIVPAQAVASNLPQADYNPHASGPPVENRTVIVPAEAPQAVPQPVPQPAPQAAPQAAPAPSHIPPVEHRSFAEPAPSFLPQVEYMSYASASQAEPAASFLPQVEYMSYASATQAEPAASFLPQVEYMSYASASQAEPAAKLISQVPSRALVESRPEPSPGEIPQDLPPTTQTQPRPLSAAAVAAAAAISRRLAKDAEPIPGQKLPTTCQEEFPGPGYVIGQAPEPIPAQAPEPIPGQAPELITSQAPSAPNGPADQVPAATPQSCDGTVAVPRPHTPALPTEGTVLPRPPSATPAPAPPAILPDLMPAMDVQRNEIYRQPPPDGWSECASPFQDQTPRSDKASELAANLIDSTIQLVKDDVSGSEFLLEQSRSPQRSEGAPAAVAPK